MASFHYQKGILKIIRFWERLGRCSEDLSSGGKVWNEGKSQDEESVAKMQMRRISFPSGLKFLRFLCTTMLNEIDLRSTVTEMLWRLSRKVTI